MDAVDEMEAWRLCVSDPSSDDLRADRGTTGERAASGLRWPYVRSMSATAIGIGAGSGGRRKGGAGMRHVLTRVLEEDEEAKLGRVRREADEEQCVAPHDKREAVVAGVSWRRSLVRRLRPVSR